MSRRHHHNVQPYDYDRFGAHSRNRDRNETTRAIEYQDDSLSSINSDEESYLHSSHTHKEKKSSYYMKNDTSKPVKFEKPEPNTFQQQKEPKVKPQTHNSADPTQERLGRLEAMLEELVKRQNAPPVEPPPAVIPEKVETRGPFTLEPRRHDFTTSMWINRIQETSIRNNWDEKTTISYMGSQMSGIVRTWYNTLPHYDYTWPEWKILITKMFPDNSDFVTTLKRLVTRLKQPDESVSQYYFSKMYLIDACKITGEDAVSCLIDGLNNQAIQEQAKTQNYLTPETLYSQFLMTLPEYTVDYAPAVPPTTETIINSWYYEEPQQEMEAEVALPEEQFEYKDERNEDFDFRSEARSVESPTKRQGPVHSRLDKRFIRPHNNFKLQNKQNKQNKIPMAARLCSICNNRGHLARNCRNADKIMLCKVQKFKSHSLFLKECSIKGRILDGFIDTGCNTVTIRQKEASILGLKLEPVDYCIETFGGGSIKPLAQTKFLLKIDKAESVVRAVVVPNKVQEFPLIVGQGFLAQKNICVFLQNETLKIFEAN